MGTAPLDVLPRPGAPQPAADAGQARSAADLRRGAGRGDRQVIDTAVFSGEGYRKARRDFLLATPSAA